MEDVLTEDWWSPEMRVGTGPFVFEEYAEGQFASVTANEDYWAGRPYLDRIVLRFFDEYETGSLAFEKGEADLLDGLTSQDVTRYAETNPEGYVFLRGNPLSANYINVADKPYLKDKRGPPGDFICHQPSAADRSPDSLRDEGCHLFRVA